MFRCCYHVIPVGADKNVQYICCSEDFQCRCHAIEHLQDLMKILKHIYHHIIIAVSHSKIFSLMELIFLTTESIVNDPHCRDSLAWW